MASVESFFDCILTDLLDVDEFGGIFVRRTTKLLTPGGSALA
jgi:hypothetical protein